MKDRGHKQAIYEQLARMGKAVAAPRRLELLDLLGQAPRNVEALAEQTAMSVANTSRHLQVLRAAGLVEGEKEGLYVTYRLASDSVGEFFLKLRALAESRLADVDRVKRRFFASADDVVPVNGKDLLARVRRGEVIVLDIRPEEEYLAGHIPGALSMPLGELKKRVSELVKTREIVAYCRGPYCIFALEAVTFLRSRGFKAVRLEDGVPDWRARGLPVETAQAQAAP